MPLAALFCKALRKKKIIPSLSLFWRLTRVIKQPQTWQPASRITHICVILIHLHCFLQYCLKTILWSWEHTLTNIRIHHLVQNSHWKFSQSETRYQSWLRNCHLRILSIWNSNSLRLVQRQLRLAKVLGWKTSIIILSRALPLLSKIN